jgi:NADPH:quinone reductase-like Zn-dependent oxidoreductase
VLVPQLVKAARVRHFGPPDVIQIEDVDTPEPGALEVLVRVAVASVGPWDSWIRAGKSVLPQPLPLTLGSDLSGTVVAVGNGVRDLAVGDPVFGVTNKRFTNAYAELALASVAMIARKPAGIEHALAASAPVVSVTALQMLFDHAKVVAGQRVLVHGAGGNVGAYAVQLATQGGAHVTGTAATRDLDYVRSLGADAVVDTSTTRFEDVVGPIDVVIDTVGGDLQTRSLGVLGAGGTLVSAVSQPDQAEAARRGVRASFILVDVNRAALTRIGELLAARKLEGRLGPTLPLGEARRAHEMLDGLVPRAPGKILLAVG